MAAIKYTGNAERVRLGALLVKKGVTLSVPDALAKELLSVEGFEVIEDAKPTKKQTKKKQKEEPAAVEPEALEEEIK